MTGWVGVRRCWIPDAGRSAASSSDGAERRSEHPGTREPYSGRDPRVPEDDGVGGRAPLLDPGSGSVRSALFTRPGKGRERKSFGISRTAAAQRRPIRDPGKRQRRRCRAVSTVAAVMRGLGPRIHAFPSEGQKTWMARPSPARTMAKGRRPSHRHPGARRRREPGTHKRWHPSLWRRRGPFPEGRRGSASRPPDDGCGPCNIARLRPPC